MTEWVIEAPSRMLSLLGTWIPCKLLGIHPELANRHVEIGTHGSHYVTANIGFSTFNFSKIVGTIPKLGGQRRL